MARMNYVGIDIGGSSLKAAAIDIASGRLVTDVQVMPTPQPLPRAQLLAAIGNLAWTFGQPRAVGIGFPCVVQKGRVITSDNLHPETAGIDTRMLTQIADCPVVLLNDAEAAARAEMQYGAGRGRTEKTLILTFGTGIGSALAHDGVVIPCEFGGLPLHGRRAELYAAAATRSIEKLTWPIWAGRVNEYLALAEQILWPELIIIGGGVSARPGLFFKYLRHRAEIVPAALRNEAGIVGAAALATGLQPPLDRAPGPSRREPRSRRLAAALA